MGPVHLAGAFSPEDCEIRLHNEQAQGMLRDTRLLGWPDLLVLTGLSNGFDRMLQLTAYARSLNPNVVVVAGGPAVRALPRRAAGFFDHACDGDVEQLREVARDALGAAYVSDEMLPRHDLDLPTRLLGYVESSRYCNFRCRFCSLTGEGHGYRKYGIDMLRRQIRAVGRKHIVFIDNNFYGNDRAFFLERVALLRELYRGGEIKGWSALVTGDFFARAENLTLAQASGCKSLFSGVESFDAGTIGAYDKRQNTVLPQVEMMRRCLDAGILFSYGIMLDPSSRRLADLRAEIGYILDNHEIPLPSYFTLAIPLPGTPQFLDVLEAGRLLPSLRLRNLDGVTVTMRPLDPVDEVIRFARDLVGLRGYRWRTLAHAAGFARRWRSSLAPLQLYAATANAALTCVPTLASAPKQVFARSPRQSFHAPSEPLDAQYKPMIRVAAQFAEHFRPTMLTDAEGELAEDVAEDLAPPGPRAEALTMVS
jgi:hypothetical protein